MLDSRDALLAAVTLPKFKVRWLTEEERREAAWVLLTTECRSAPGGVEPGASHQESAASYSTSAEKDFFAFDEMEGDTASLNSETEVIDYFKSGSELAVLSRFPNIKRQCHITSIWPTCSVITMFLLKCSLRFTDC